MPDQMPNSSGKMDGALAELEEASYWLELLGESEIVSTSRLVELRGEANELLAILVTCIKNVKQKARAKHDA